MSAIQHLIAVGDCNTLGAGSLEGNSYPERIGKRLGCKVTNLGYTMSTSREGVRRLRDLSVQGGCLLIQFGLVDSYTTFKYAPYVLYYPDNMIRKPLRSVVKKLNKSCRRSGLNQILGVKNVVSIEEYERNIREMVEVSRARLIFLLETIPHLEVERNENIRKYNRVLENISADYDHCEKIDLYDIFASQADAFYLDSTHSNGAGYDCIADILRIKLQQAG